MFFKSIHQHYRMYSTCWLFPKQLGIGIKYSGCLESLYLFSFIICLFQAALKPQLSSQHHSAPSGQKKDQFLEAECCRRIMFTPCCIGRKWKVVMMLWLLNIIKSPICDDKQYMMQRDLNKKKNTLARITLTIHTHTKLFCKFLECIYLGTAIQQKTISTKL